jgi:hypothetical protein
MGRRIKVSGSGLRGEANNLVRLQDMDTRNCFHVSFSEEPDTIDVFVVGNYRILDLENVELTPEEEKIDFSKIVSSRSKLTKTEKVRALVTEFPFRTSTELASKVNPSVLTQEEIHKRLPDLRKKGLLSNPSVRKCAITGKTAQTWAPKSLVTEAA